MAEEIVGKVICRVGDRDYSIYFTDKRIIGEFLGGTALAYAAGGLVGQAIARGRHKKKGKKVIEEEKTPEQILASHKKNFSIDYRDIDKATVKRKACKMKFAAKQFGLPRGLRKKVVFLYDKKDKDSIASALTKVIPDKVVVK